MATPSASRIMRTREAATRERERGRWVLLICVRKYAHDAERINKISWWVENLSGVEVGGKVNNKTDRDRERQRQRKKEFLESYFSTHAKRQLLINHLFTAPYLLNHLSKTGRDWSALLTPAAAVLL